MLYLSENPMLGPTGVAPTQELGYKWYDLGQFEGFLTVSARLPEQVSLVIFPDRLRSGSSVTFTDPATGQQHAILDDK
ncbi:MAG: hypothetical protein ACREBD_11765 [Blastocatellia bacterium]